MTNQYSSEDIKSILTDYTPKTNHWREGLTPAAVLAPFYPDPNGLSLIFTKRTSNLVNHRGQISFPGGRKDPEDGNLQFTALRETWEEIGVKPEDIQIWGRLNQEATITSFSVAPFVGLIPYPYDFKLNDQEVERLIIVPLSHLMNPDNFSVELFPWAGKDYQTYKYPYKKDVIWGATARIVHNLLTLITTGREPDQTHFKSAARTRGNP